MPKKGIFTFRLRAIWRNKVYEELKVQGLFTHRCFYTLITNFPPNKELETANKDNLKIANNILEKCFACIYLYLL